MCNNEASRLPAPYGMKPSSLAESIVYNPIMRHALPAFDYHRAQLYDYTARLRYGLAFSSPMHPYAAPGQEYPHGFIGLAPHDPRARFLHEEPKPSQSYIGLIGMAIMSSSDKKMVLSDIYQYILDNYPYFRARGPGWRNSIRHNLSLNDCFIKAGRSANGKGHFWAIHPANIEDFARGDFRRRRAQRKVRKYMGLSVPDDDEDDDTPPGPVSPTVLQWKKKMEEYLTLGSSSCPNTAGSSKSEFVLSEEESRSNGMPLLSPTMSPPACSPIVPSRKRQFDMESLLAPDTEKKRGDLALPSSDIKKPDIRSVSPEDVLIPRVGAESMGVIRPTLVAYENGGFVWAPSLPTGLWHSPNSAFTSLWRTPSTASSFHGGGTIPDPRAESPDEDVDVVTPPSTAEKWQQTFSKILARSYNNKASTSAKDTETLK